VAEAPPPGGTVGSTAPPGLSRENLPDRILETLSRGGWGKADVHLVALDGGGRAVVKDFARRPAWVRATLGRFVIAHEARTYARLEGVPAVPRLLGRLDSLAIVLEYRPGTLLSRSLSGRLPAAFMLELAASVREMHARGVVHLDLRHRSNVLAGRDDHPVVIDFASAVTFRPGGIGSRTLQPLLALIDRGAVRKWRSKIPPRLD